VESGVMEFRTASDNLVGKVGENAGQCQFYNVRLLSNVSSWSSDNPLTQNDL
jgi:hypothetical protein